MARRELDRSRCAGGPDPSAAAGTPGLWLRSLGSRNLQPSPNIANVECEMLRNILGTGYYTGWRGQSRGERMRF